MRIVLACLVALGTAIPVCNAADFQMLGAGTSSCGSWTASRRHPNSAAAIMYEAWVLGFLSGVGSVAAARVDPLEGLDYNAVDGWVDNYCRDHPLDRIEGAAVQFVSAHPH
jgi:hypothetical protein